MPAPRQPLMRRATSYATSFRSPASRSRPRDAVPEARLLELLQLLPRQPRDFVAGRQPDDGVILRARQEQVAGGRRDPCLVQMAEGDDDRFAWLQRQGGLHLSLIHI